VLGTEGSRGLSHPKVDQRAGLPAGTTSYYFRTRKALLLATAERISELDEAALSKMAELGADGSAGYSGTLGLARLVMRSGTGPRLTRSRARYEIVLRANRDPDLAATMIKMGLRFYSLARDVITKWHPVQPPPVAALIDEQAVMVLTFIDGVMMSFVHGYPVVSDAEHLDHQIQAILRSVATDNPRGNGIRTDQRRASIERH
jgi:AcrR family transcriptional regulator